MPPALLFRTISRRWSADADDREAQSGRSRLGDTGLAGRTGAIRAYCSPSVGRGSASPLLGQNDIARSAWAVIVSDGLTPRLAEIADPSAMCSPG